MSAPPAVPVGPKTYAAGAADARPPCAGGSTLGEAGADGRACPRSERIRPVPHLGGRAPSGLAGRRGGSSRLCCAMGSVRRPRGGSCLAHASIFLGASRWPQSGGTSCRWGMKAVLHQPLAWYPDASHDCMPPAHRHPPLPPSAPPTDRGSATPGRLQTPDLAAGKPTSDSLPVTPASPLVPLLLPVRPAATYAAPFVRRDALGVFLSVRSARAPRTTHAISRLQAGSQLHTHTSCHDRLPFQG
jgi:hypothetical protein